MIRDSMHSVRENVASLGNLALSCYGPGGRSKVLGASTSTPAGVITTISGRLINGLRLPNPYIQLLLQTSVMAQQQQHGDGGLLALYLACRLVVAGLEPGTSNTKRRAMCDAYQQCLADITSFLGQQLAYSSHAAGQKRSHGNALATHASTQATSSQQQSFMSPAGHSSWSGSDTDSSDDDCSTEGHSLACAPTWRPCFNISGQGVQPYLALARAVLSSKPATGLSHAGREAAILKLVQGHVACLPDTQTAADSAAAPAYRQPRLLVLPSLQPEQFDICEGVLLDVQPFSRAVFSLLPKGPCLVAVFDVPLEPASETTTAGSSTGMQLQAGSHGWSPVTCELEALVQLLISLRQQGVRLVACQKGIHKEVVEVAQGLGLLPLARLSAVHTQQLLAATGALPISSLLLPADSAALWSSHLGATGGIQVKELANKIVLYIMPGFSSSTCQTNAATCQQLQRLDRCAPGSVHRRQPCVTLLLGAPSQTCCDELRAAATAVLRVLHTASRIPLAVPGGGAAEGLVANHLQQCCRQRQQGHCLSAVQVQAYELVIKSLLDLAHTLASNSGCAPDIIRDAVRSIAADIASDMVKCRSTAHVDFLGWLHDEQQYAVLCSWDVANKSEHQFSWLRSAQLLDSLPVKLSAITAGVHAACMLLKIDAVLMDPG